MPNDHEITVDIVPNLDALAEGFTRMFVRLTTSRALVACLDQDDETAARTLAALDPQQLRDVENAAVALALHASRLRADEDQGEADEPAQVRMDNSHAAFTPNQPPARLDLDALNRGIIEALTRWHETGTPNTGAELAGIREVIDPFIADLTERARLAEQVARQGITDYQSLTVEHGEAVNRADRNARERHHARIEADKQRRRAESSEDASTRYMRWLNAARDAANAKDWPSLPEAITTIRHHRDEAEAALARGHALADRWDRALSVDRPYARDLRAALGKDEAAPSRRMSP